MRRTVPMLAMALAFSLVAEAAIAAITGGFSVELSRSRRVLLPGVAATISVADPTIADVAVLDSHSVLVVGKAFGVTDIIVTDHAGRLLMDSRVAVVPTETQRLTVTRGQAVSDYVCVGRCSPAVSASGGAAASTQAAGQSAAPSQAAPVTPPQVNAAPVAPRSPP